MIRVAALRTPRIGFVRGRDHQVVGTISKAWSIHDENGRRSEYVVDVPWGLTVINSQGYMLTCWHAGITPGDLARHVLEKDTQTAA